MNPRTSSLLSSQLSSLNSLLVEHTHKSAFIVHIAPEKPTGFRVIVPAAGDGPQLTPWGYWPVATTIPTMLSSPTPTPTHRTPHTTVSAVLSTSMRHIHTDMYTHAQARLPACSLASSLACLLACFVTGAQASQARLPASFEVAHQQRSFFDAHCSQRPQPEFSSLPDALPAEDNRTAQHCHCLLHGISPLLQR